MRTRVFEIEGHTFVECADCGADAEWIDCESCTDGFVGHDCGEDTCPCANPEDNVRCDVCGGDEGWYRCTSGACPTNAPRPGEEGR